MNVNIQIASAKISALAFSRLVLLSTSVLSEAAFIRSLKEHITIGQPPPCASRWAGFFGVHEKAALSRKTRSFVPAMEEETGRK